MYENSNPELIAKAFCQEYKQSEDVRKGLTQLLEEHLRKTLLANVEEESSDHEQ
jgi:hypothetical protein